MIRRFRQWLQPSAREIEDESNALNPSTMVDIHQLIGLQRYAGKLDLTRKQPAHARIAGNHYSRFRGRGMDYQESRVYQPGDDIRNMDWRVTARAGKPHTKVYQEERERPIILFIDVGSNMFFATQGALKSVIAAQTAVLLGWAAAAHGDRIGAFLFNGEHHELRPKTGKRGVLQLIHSLVNHSNPVQGMKTVRHKDSLNQALERLQRIARPGSMIFMISDFTGIDQHTADHLLRLHQHNNMAAMHIYDPLELTPPPPGRYAITDGDTTGVLDTRSQKDAYQRYFKQQENTLHSVMRQCSLPLYRIGTNDNVPAIIQSVFGMPHRSHARTARQGVA